MCREPLPGHNSPSVTRRVLAELLCSDMATDRRADRQLGGQTGETTDGQLVPSLCPDWASVDQLSIIIDHSCRTNQTRKLSGHLQPHVTDLITSHWLSLTCDQEGKNMVGSPFPARSR